MVKASINHLSSIRLRPGVSTIALDETYVDGSVIGFPDDEPYVSVMESGRGDYLWVSLRNSKSVDDITYTMLAMPEGDPIESLPEIAALFDEYSTVYEDMRNPLRVTGRWFLYH